MERIKKNFIPLVLLLIFIPGTVCCRNEETYIKKGIEHYEAKEFEKALDEFVKVLETDPANFKALDFIQDITAKITEEKKQKFLKEGCKKYVEKNYPEARENFERVIEIDPDNRKAKSYISKIEKKMGKGKEKRLLTAGYKYYADKDYYAALDSFIEVLIINPENKDAQKFVNEIKDRIVAMRKDEERKKEEERKRLARALGKEKKEIESGRIKKMVQKFYKKGLEYYAAKEYRKALDEWDNVLLWEPDNKEVKQKAEDAEKNLTAVIQSGINSALEHYRKGELSKSLNRWVKVLELEPANVQAKSYIKRLTVKLGEKAKDVKGATAAAEKIKKKEKIQITSTKKIGGKTAAELYIQGMIEYSKGNLEKAINEWKSVLTLQPGNERAIKAIERTKEELKRKKRK